MSRPRHRAPTDAEMEVLTSLWARGEGSVRDVQDDFVAAEKKHAYTSIATIMRICVEKGFAEVTDVRRPQKFRAVISETDAWKMTTDQWMHRMCNGSLAEFIRRTLVGRQLSRRERDELCEVIKKAK